MDKLFVYYGREKVGEIRRDEDLVFSFSYEQSWQKGLGSFPLSLVMPLEKKDYGNRETLSFFENLLPEGEVREILEKTNQIKGTFSFLREFGQDCAGAITVSENPPKVVKNSEEGLTEIKLEKIYEAIDEKETAVELIAESRPGYLSLAGAQDKFPAVVRKGKIYLPKSGSPTTHIVKTPILRNSVKESVYNEYYIMELARKVGLEVPRCTILKGKHPLYIIERYDRISNGDVKRIHQQDFCQAQGLTSEFKYEGNGGPSIKDDYNLIIKNVSSRSKIKDAERFLDWVCFNLIVGNNDSHSKNISFLLNDGKIELAPFYDLMCTAIYPRLKSKFSFKIGGRDDYSVIGESQIKAIEEEIEVKSGTLFERMRIIHDRILKEKDELAMMIQKEHKECKIVKRISDLIEKRARALAKQT